MRRGLERYAPGEGYDPGSLARSKLSQIVVRKAGLFPGDWVLDVETGTGILGVNVARAFTRSKVVATDADRDHLERALANARREGCEGRMRFIQCLPHALPLKGESFFFTTVGLRLAEEDDPFEVFDEVHRATGYGGKVYMAALDLRKAREKPRGTILWLFQADTLDELRDIGFGKVQMQQVAVLADGARLYLVMMKRFDPEAEEEEGEEGGEEGEKASGEDDKEDDE